MIERLSRPNDGRVMCCLCFELKHRNELWVDEEGVRWDVCISCHRLEEEALARREEK